MDFKLTEQRAFQTLARDFARERMVSFARASDEDDVFRSRRCANPLRLG